MSAVDFNVVVLASTLVLFAAVIAVRLSIGAGLPSLLVYLGIGLVIGEAALGVEFEDTALTQNLGLLALAIILAEGGLTTRWSVIRPVVKLSIVLSTVGVLVSVAVTAAVAHFGLGFDWRTSMLLGSVVSSTDAAAVFSVLRRVRVRPRLAAAVEAESGFNDPLVIILVVIIVSDAWANANIALAVGQVVYQLVVGVLCGLVVGRAGQWLLVRSALPAVGLYPLATMAIALFAYAVAGTVAASGFAAVYVAGLWLGNARLPHRGATLGFAEGLAWLAQIGLFVLLGLLASPARLPGALLPALVVGGGLLLLARPLSVFVCATWFRMPWREQAFMSWAGLRGAVPIVLATIPIGAGMPGPARDAFDIVFLLVIVFTLIQGPTLPFAAKRLDVAETASPREVDVDSAPLEEVSAGLLQLRVPEASRLAGVYIDELRLPRGAAVTLIVREGRNVLPDSNTAIMAGDHLLIVATDEVRKQTERRLRAVSRAGKLARWYGEHGEDNASPP